MIHFEIGAADFRKHIFERQPHLQGRALSELAFDWHDLQDALLRIEGRAPDVKLYRDTLVAEEHFARDVVEAGVRRRRFDKAGLYAQLHLGATLILNRFEFRDAFARQLCRSIAGYARMQTTSNAYLSFGGSGSFGKHWDTHDVFAVQVLGRKRWQVFEPTLPLPLSHQTSDKATQMPTQSAVLDCILERGDVLYIPRGWWHRTVPFDEGSFHVSVGTYGATVQDYILWAVARELSHKESARASFLEPGAHDAVLADLGTTLGQLLLDSRLQTQFQREFRSREHVQSDFNLPLFCERGKVPSAAARVRLTMIEPVVLEDGSLAVNGVSMRLDPVGQAIVNVLTSTGEISYARLGSKLNAVDTENLLRSLFALVSRDVVSLTD